MDVSAARVEAVNRFTQTEWAGHGAVKTVVSTFGLVVAMAGVEHGVGEMLQGPVAPAGLAFQSWPGAGAFQILGGEPAMSVIPNMFVTGVLAVTAALALAAWAVSFAKTPRGPIVLLGLSVLLLLVGGGIAPALIGVALAAGATRIRTAGGRRPGRVRRALAMRWRALLAGAVLGYLSLFPGLVLLSALTGIDEPSIVVALAAWSFTGLILALVASTAADQLAAEQGLVGRPLPSGTVFDVR